MNTHILAIKSGFWKAQNPEHSERIFAHSILASPVPTCNRLIRIDLFAAPYALKYFLALWEFIDEAVRYQAAVPRPWGRGGGGGE